MTGARTQAKKACTQIPSHIRNKFEVSIYQCVGITRLETIGATGGLANWMVQGYMGNRYVLAHNRVKRGYRRLLIGKELEIRRRCEL